MMQPLPSLSQAYRLILQEKIQRDCYSATTISHDSAALASSYQRNMNSNFVQQSNRSGPYKGGTSNYGGQHNQQHVFGLTRSGRKSRYYCQHCKVYGYSVERCYKFHGYPNGPKPNVREQNFRGKGLAGTAVTDTQEEMSNHSDCSNQIFYSNDANSSSSYPNGLRSSGMQASNSVPPPITQDQYQELISLLNQHKFEGTMNSGNNGDHTSSNALLAGSQHEAFSGAW